MVTRSTDKVCAAWVTARQHYQWISFSLQPQMFCQPTPFCYWALFVLSPLFFLFALSSLLLLEENEVYRKNKEYHRNKVVPLQCLALEQYRYYHAEYKAWDDFLYNLQLDQWERTAVDFGTDAVGGDKERVLEQCNAPAYKYNENNGCAWRDNLFKRHR